MTPRESGQTSLGSCGARKFDQPLEEAMQMTAVATLAGAGLPWKQAAAAEEYRVVAFARSGGGASRKRRLPRLEPYAVKVACTVLRGGGDGNAASLPDRREVVMAKRGGRVPRYLREDPGGARRKSCVKPGPERCRPRRLEPASPEQLYGPPRTTVTTSLPASIAAAFRCGRRAADGGTRSRRDQFIPSPGGAAPAGRLVGEPLPGR